MRKLVLNVVGLPASGKSRVCDHLAEAFGFEVRRPSDVLRVYAKAHDIALAGREDYVRVHHLLNKENPRAIIEPVIATSAERICLDGLRSPFLLEELRKQPFTVVTIALECPFKERFHRVQLDDERRGTHRAPATPEAFRADEQADLHNDDPNLPNMNEMFRRADYHVDASKPTTEVLQVVDGIVGRLIA